MVRGMLVSALWLVVLAPADWLARPPSLSVSRLLRLRRGLPVPDVPAAPDAADCLAEDPEDDLSGDPPASCPAASANPDAAHAPSHRRRPGPHSAHAPPPLLIYAHCALLL